MLTHPHFAGVWTPEFLQCLASNRFGHGNHSIQLMFAGAGPKIGGMREVAGRFAGEMQLWPFQ